MNFKIDATLPATPASLWAIFFDVQRIAGLIPGCASVTEVVPRQEFSAVMQQRIGPFRMEVPTRIALTSQTPERQVVLSASGRDKTTGTTIDVRMAVDLDDRSDGDAPACKLLVDAQLLVAGRLASLGYPIVQKRSQELFAEFERRLRDELRPLASATSTDAAAAVRRAPAAAGVSAPVPAGGPAPVPAGGPAPAPAGVTASPTMLEQAPPTPATAPQAYAAPEHAPAPFPSRGPASAPAGGLLARAELVLVWPRVGFTLAAGLAVAHGAAAFGQSPGWWIVAPLLGVAAGLGRRSA